MVSMAFAYTGFNDKRCVEVVCFKRDLHFFMLKIVIMLMFSPLILRKWYNKRGAFYIIWIKVLKCRRYTNLSYDDDTLLYRDRVKYYNNICCVLVVRGVTKQR